MKTVALDSLGVEAPRNRSALPRAACSGENAGQNRPPGPVRMTQAERSISSISREDDPGHSGLMRWQLLQQFLGEPLGRGVLHAVDTRFHRPDRSETNFALRAIHQEIRGRFVIRRRVWRWRLVSIRVVIRQIRPVRPIAVKRSIKSLLQGFAGWYSANLMLEDRPLIVKMRASAGFMHAPSSFCKSQRWPVLRRWSCNPHADARNPCSSAIWTTSGFVDIKRFAGPGLGDIHASRNMSASGLET